MMGYYNYMMAGAGSVMLFYWLVYVLALTLMVLGIIALWKYINKK